ncbi:hypothetical protein CONCODRAFT_167123 [Conidiobolus coronatus NRRL 28638]|uniref:Uncharacterized protein n=1 Tax=Conidiobolus coronatus (strain ATCC 28846 / CBS 209.66 / NRRL 28638) TaxID=796925 RepID=A0A137NY65_CONC2|nr:hypothetical protein CONCODRAFT_167123 [Conidiobolus coronatus NRRL 28638]|eukprot:KXN67735.1 hypothetical protein CONCODRAFT_167123 [Conidiobolus coronatus NRRL 28638]
MKCINFSFVSILIGSILSSPVTHLDTEFLGSDFSDFSDANMIPGSLMDTTITEAKSINEENVSLECLLDEFCYKPQPKTEGELKASSVQDSPPPYLKFSPTNHFDMNEYLTERYIKHMGEYEKYGKSINHAEDYHSSYD